MAERPLVFKGRSRSSRIFPRWFILLAVLLFFTVANAAQGNDYLTLSNISVIINQSCFLTIIGIAQALTLLTGGINLSIGSVMAFTTVMWGRMLVGSSPDVHYIVPILLIVGTGMCIGLVNGLLITKLRMPSFIATFATMYACRGLAWLALGKKVIYNLNGDFRFLGTGVVARLGSFTLTVPMLIVLVMLVITGFMLRGPTLGDRSTSPAPTPWRPIRGHPDDRVLIWVYVLSTGWPHSPGCSTGRASIPSSRHGGQRAVRGHHRGLIGGISMSGGFGNIWGILCGSIIVSTIYNGMNTLSVASELQTLVMGALIIFAVAFNQFLIKENMELRNELDVRASA
jgi:ribose/xylose/arabinose/galactoside ABC-type transport system permease subunit